MNAIKCDICMDKDAVIRLRNFANVCPACKEIFEKKFWEAFNKPVKELVGTQRQTKNN